MLKDKRKYILLLLKTDEYSTKQKYWDPTPDRCRMTLQILHQMFGAQNRISTQSKLGSKRGNMCLKM